MTSLTLFLCSISIGLDKGGIPGAAALGMVVAIAVAAGGGSEDEQAKGSESAVIIASLVPILFSADICAVYVYRNLVRWELVGLLSLPCVLGIVVGAALLGFLSERLIQQCVGFALILTAVAHFLSKQIVTKHDVMLPVADGAWDGARGKIDKSIEPFPILGSILFGFTIGVCTMLANMAGPILVCYLLKRGLVKTELNATRAWLFVFVNCLKLPLQWYLGNLNYENFANLWPMCFVAMGVTWITERYIMPRVNQEAFEKAAWTFVVLSAGKLFI
jgi:hypothetical protein